MYVTRVPTVVSLQQLEEDERRKETKLTSRRDIAVGNCITENLLKVSFAFKSETHCTRVRSFGELQNLEDWESRQEISSALSDESCPSETGDSLLSVETGEPGELDALMLGLWNMCNDDGLFRYDVTACSTKVLPGVYGFIAQLNEGRASKKRPTEFRVDQVVQPFDSKKFNFNKAYMKEVLFQFETNALQDTVIDEDALVTKSPHLVMINVSPIEYGHVLLVPSVLDNLPQLVTSETMLLAIKFTAAVNNPYFRVGYNSLGAYATINHLHFQGYYLMAPYPVERAPTTEIKDEKYSAQGVRVSMLAEYPVKGLVFEKIGSLEQLSNIVARACMKMQACNIPHNILISDCGARVFLWPQCYAEKQSLNQVPEDILSTGVNPAAFEIAGHMVLKSATDYEDISQKKAWRMLAEVSLAEEQFQNVIHNCLE